jgi:hypothetical protein
MQENEKKNEKWGGARQGAGRKKKYTKTCFFNATEEVVAIIEAIPRNKRADFINRCISYYHMHSQEE